MAYVTLHAHRVHTVDVQPVRFAEGRPWTTVRLEGEDATFHIDGAFGNAVPRARALAAAINAACDAAEEAERHRDQLSLTVDPVNPADLESVRVNGRH